MNAYVAQNEGEFKISVIDKLNDIINRLNEVEKDIKSLRLNFCDDYNYCVDDAKESVYKLKKRVRCNAVSVDIFLGSFKSVSNSVIVGSWVD